MYIQQFYTQGLSHLSYLLGSSASFAVVDPSRDTQEYLNVARDMGLTITHILLTHLHADFISGFLDLQETTGATIYAPEAARCSFDHEPVAEGKTIIMDDLAIWVRETPGHTPEHISYVVADRSRGEVPVSVFCGDTLFVGDVGRPDLFPGMADELAERLYESLHKKLLTLPDFCEVYPAHGAGSLCGRAIGAKRFSTIGYERRYNVALLHPDVQTFKEALLSNIPDTPDHFSRCSAINARGPSLVRTLPVPRPMGPDNFFDAVEKGAIVVDIRDYTAFGGAHVPGSYHLDPAGNFSTFAGWILPPDRPILLVGNNDEDIRRATLQLHRVGLDQVEGYLDGGMNAWAVNGKEIAYVPHMSVHQLKEKLTQGEDLIVLDVRARGEWDEYHIDGAMHIPAPHLRKRYDEVDTHRPVAVHCNTTHRSSMAASVLKQHGFNNISVVTGGMTAWQAAGYAEICPVCEAPHLPRLSLHQRY